MERSRGLVPLSPSAESGSQAVYTFVDNGETPGPTEIELPAILGIWSSPASFAGFAADGAFLQGFGQLYVTGPDEKYLEIALPAGLTLIADDNRCSVKAYNSGTDIVYPAQNYTYDNSGTSVLGIVRDDAANWEDNTRIFLASIRLPLATLLA